MSARTLLKLLFLCILTSVFLSLFPVIYALICLNSESPNTLRNMMHTRLLSVAFKIDWAENYSKAISELDKEDEDKIWIVNRNGKILATTEKESFPFNLSEVKWPEKPYKIHSHDTGVNVFEKHFVIRFNRHPNNFLILRIGTGAPLSRPPRFIIISFLAIGILSFMFAILAVLVYMRSKSTIAREIISRIDNGDLKARFKIDHLDETGKLMLDFNRMADTIENLVIRLREVENARSNILQELGHDLRTPLTSLGTSVDVLSSNWKDMSDTQRDEITSLIKNDIQYFKRLIEDLFFLSEMSVVKFNTSITEIDIVALVAGEIEIYAGDFSDEDKKIKWEFSDDTDSADFSFKGDHLLIQRLFKNIYKNSSQFARSMVKTEVNLDRSNLNIRILDDGPGMTEEQIKNYGSRRRTRIIPEKSGGNVSLGLGSVIILNILEFHSGKLELKNIKDGAGKTCGLEIIIILPLS